MTIGFLSVRLHMPDSNSLKAKRRILKSLIERSRNRFNISISEIDEHDKWQVAVLGVSAVSNSSRYVDEVLSKVLNFIETVDGADIIDHQLELL